MSRGLYYHPDLVVVAHFEYLILLSMFVIDDYYALIVLINCLFIYIQYYYTHFIKILIKIRLLRKFAVIKDLHLIMYA